MFAIVQNNEIVKTGGSIRTLFPNISSLRVVHLPSSKQTTVLWKWLAVSRKTKGSTGSLLRILICNWWTVFQHSCLQTHLKS
jgi:hypothetical protein